MATEGDAPQPERASLPLQSGPLARPAPDSMADKQRRPRTSHASPSSGTELRRPVRPPMDSGIFALLRRGNQAMNEQVAARRDRDSAPAQAPDTDPHQAVAAAALEPASYVDVWADIQDMIAHGDFTFRQLVSIIEGQEALTPQERIRMKEEARQLYQARRDGEPAR